MAARSHVDATVSERRLRPIYDYLDNENNKKALQESEKLIRKHKDPKDVLCAKALKALALIRLGRQDEAQTVIQEVETLGPTDEGTLRAMTICFLELHKPECIAEAYEKALKKDPNNEELLSHLFMSYVRNSEYKKQQQTAVALYKLKPKNPYYFWAIMSIVMQATSGDEKLAKSMLLPLAERMAVKFVNEEKIEAEAEVQLYLMILELQGKYEDALHVLDGPLKDHLPGYLNTITEKRAELLTRMEKFPLANAAFKKLIMSNPDQWAYYIDYFDSLTKIVESGWEPTEPCDTLDADYSFDQAIALLNALVEEQNRVPDGRVLRGPYLAQIDLLYRLLNMNSEEASKLGTMIDLIVMFFRRFGSKPSCFLDLSHVINNLIFSDEDKNLLLEQLKSALNDDCPDEHHPNDVNQMYRHICYCQLCHYLGHHEHWSVEQQLAYAQELIKHYNYGLQFGQSLLPTEFQPCDNYCLLASHIIFNVWKQLDDDVYILECIMLLERSLKSSPSNFQIKILLLKFYNIIGAVGISFQLYESVDVKHIQQETLGYLITDPLLSAAFYTIANAVLGNSIRFYMGNYKDTVDYLMSCYKYGSFTKIPEIVQFREKLNNSLHYAVISAERTLLEMLVEIKSQQDLDKVLSTMEIDPEKDKPTEHLTDNRDVSILRAWSAKDKKETENQLEKSFQEKVIWLKIRNLMVRCIAAVFQLTKTEPHNQNEITNGVKRGMSDVLSDLLANLKDVVEAINVDTLLNSLFPIEAPGPTRLLRYLLENNVDLFILLLELALNLYRLVEGSTEAEEKSCLKIISDSKKRFQTLPKKLELTLLSDQGFSKLSKVKVFLEDFTNCVETFSLGTLLVGLSHEILKPARSSLMRKGKKKKVNTALVTAEIFQELDTLLVNVEDTGQSLQNLLSQFGPSFVATQMGQLSIKEKNVLLEDREELIEQITPHIELSYASSVKELKEVVTSKIKYLQSLKW